MGRLTKDPLSFCSVRRPLVSLQESLYSLTVDFDLFCESLCLIIVVCDSVSLLFPLLSETERPVEAELRDAASPQKSLHPTETSGGPAAGRGGVSL